MLRLRAGCFQGVRGQRQGVGDKVSEVGTRWLDWEGGGDEVCGFGMSRLGDTPRLETGEGEGWGQSVEVGDSMSVLVTVCLGWGQGVRAGDKV